MNKLNVHNNRRVYNPDMRLNAEKHITEIVCGHNMNTARYMRFIVTRRIHECVRSGEDRGFMVALSYKPLGGVCTSSITQQTQDVESILV